MRQAMKEAMEIPQWEEDYKLSALPDHHMFWEYLEVGEILDVSYSKLLEIKYGFSWSRSFTAFTLPHGVEVKYQTRRIVFGLIHF